MSMREDFEAAIEEMGDEVDLEVTPQEVITAEEPEIEVDATEGGESEEIAEPANRTSAKKTKKSATAPAESAEGDDKTDTRSLKAPVNWGAKDRQDWSRIPPTLQSKILAREQEIATTMQNSAAARSTHEEFTQLANTYGSVLSGLGDTPMATVKTLFNTVAGLRMGSPTQKAQMISDLIADFGVDIGTLDTVLSGSTVSQAQPQVQNQHFEDLLNQRLAPMQQFLNQQQEAVKSKAVNEVQAFAEKAEFINDVRMDMADLIEFSANRGTPITMQQAYQKACALNPQVSQVLQERAQKQKLLGTQNTLNEKRAASTSLSSNRGGSGGVNGRGMSLRSDLLNAIDGMDS